MATIGFSGLGNSFKSALVANRGHRFSAVVSQKVAFCCDKYDLELHSCYHSHVHQPQRQGWSWRQMQKRGAATSGLSSGT
jgi:hypothetical protein